MLEDLPEGFGNHHTRPKHLFKLRELASTMGQTVAANQRPFIRGIAGERIRHHQRLAPLGLPVAQQRLQILPGMGAPGKIQADRLRALLHDQRRGVHPRPPLGRVINVGLAVFSDERQNPHMRVVLIDHLALRRQGLQLFKDRVRTNRPPLDLIPLGGIETGTTTIA